MTQSRGITLTLAYTVFAVVATVVNIGTQELFLRMYAGALSLIASVGMGTVTGLLVKYVLDKRYIFRFQTDDAMHNTRTFLLYSLMGVLTTLIFWGFEFGFQYLFASKELRYLGGIIGLGIGYVSKYHLDKQFVFRKVVSP
jgi:putative flippase GtrA